MKYLYKFMDAARVVAEKIRKSIYNRLKKDDNSGKLVETSKLKVIFKVLATVFVVIFIYNVVTTKDDNKNFSKFEREEKPTQTIGEPIGVDSDRNNKVKEELARDFDRILNNKGRTNYVVSASNTGTSAGGKTLEGKPNVYECKEILGKISRGEALDEETRLKGMACQENNTLGLSAEQNKAFEKALDPNIDPKISSALASYALNPNPDKNDPNVIAVEGYLSNDETRKRAAEQLLANPNLTQDQKNQLLKVANNEVRGVEAEKLLASLPPIPKNNEPTFGTSDKESANKFNSTNSYSGSGENLQQQANEIAKLDDDITRVKDRVDVAEKAIQDAAKTGDTDTIAANSSEYKAQKERLESLQSERDRKVLVFNKTYRDKQNDILEAKSIAKGVSVSSIKTIQAEDDIPEFKPRKINARELTPDELRILDLLNQGKRKDLASNKKPVDLSKYEGTDQPAELAKMIVSGIQKKGGLILPGGVRIPAVLETDILCSENNMNGFPVHIRGLADVMNPMNNSVSIYKNAIFIGKTTGFDVDSEIINIQITEVVMGPVTEKISINVQLQGKVKDTRGKQITAALLTDFVASVADKVAKDAADSVDSSTATVMDTLNIASITGATSGAQKISQLLAKDLEKARKLFVAKRGMAITLYP